jgi:8-oxo-dGTP diphosphatase
MITKEVAGCVILNENREVFLLHRDTQKWQHWEIPGGKLDNGETPEQAAIREVKEESKLTVSIIKKLGVGKFSDGDTEFIYHWFLARITDGKPEIAEKDIFNGWGYFAWEKLQQPDMVLSSSLKAFLRAMFEGEVVL